jgi:hypothetical protein
MKLNEVANGTPPTSKRGEQVLLFSEYINNPKLGLQKKLIPLFEKLGDTLFKDGWGWNDAEFVKRPFIIAYPREMWKSKAKCMVRIHYNERVASNGPGTAYVPARRASDTYDIADIVTNLQASLDEVKAMATS